MVARLWFSLCALVAFLIFVIGVIGVIGNIANGLTSERPMDWVAVLASGAFGFFGPMPCLFIYRWGLWVARGSRA
jgi:hypothetical protein